MTGGRLNLLADAAEAIEVPVSPAVLASGADAVDAEGRPLFAHRHLPSMPSALGDEVEWQAALDLAEAALRGEDPTHAILGPRGFGGHIGTCGPGRPAVTASGAGVVVGPGDTGRPVRRPRLFPALAERPEVEPGVARARDLAEAYGRLDHHGRVYGRAPWEEGRTPVPPIRGLPSEARAPGGDPGLPPHHTDHMREGTRP